MAFNTLDSEDTAMSQASSGNVSKFKISRQITVGDLIICCTFVVSAFKVYGDFDKRVERLEYSGTLEQSRTKESLLDLKVDIKEIQGIVNSMQREMVRLSNQSYQQGVVQSQQVDAARKGK